MVTYIIRRVLISLLIVFLISIFAFSLMHVLPGDPARISLGEEASQEAVDELRAEWNLDKPLLTQYWLWVSGIFTKDFGESYAFNRPVYDIISERLPRTLAIGVPAIVIAAIFGVCFGILSAVKRGKWLDQVLSLLWSSNGFLFRDLRARQRTLQNMFIWQFCRCSACPFSCRLPSHGKRVQTCWK